MGRVVVVVVVGVVLEIVFVTLGCDIVVVVAVVVVVSPKRAKSSGVFGGLLEPVMTFVLISTSSIDGDCGDGGCVDVCTKNCVRYLIDVY